MPFIYASVSSVLSSTLLLTSTFDAEYNKSNVKILHVNDLKIDSCRAYVDLSINEILSMSSKADSLSP